MNSWAPISGLVCPSRASRATWTSWGRQRVARVRGEPARGLARGEELAAGALGERLGTETAEVGVGAAQQLARLRAAVLASQPLAVHEPAARVRDRGAAAHEPLDRLAVRVWQLQRKTVLFVTHGIDEAIFLGDRVVAMSPRPGRIQEIVEVDLPRPRDEPSEGFNKLRRVLRELLMTDSRVD